MISLRLWLRRACGKSRRKGAAMKSAFWFCSKLNVGKNLCLNHQGAMNYSRCWQLYFFNSIIIFHSNLVSQRLSLFQQCFH